MEVISNHIDQLDDATNANNNNNHGWQKVTYAKRQRKTPVKTNQPAEVVHSEKLVPNGSDSVFNSLEKKSEDRRRQIEAQKAAISASYETAPVVRSSRNYSDDEDDSNADDAAGGGVSVGIDEKKVKPKRVKKPKVTVADAVAKIDAVDLATFIADVTEITRIREAARSRPGIWHFRSEVSHRNVFAFVESPRRFY